MSSGDERRTWLIALSAFVAGATIATAVVETLVFTDFTSVVVVLGLIAGAGLLLATLLLMRNPVAGALVAMLAGLLTLLVGAVEIGVVGLAYTTPSGATQPAWAQELFDVVAGASIGGLGLGMLRSAAPGSGSARLT